MGTTSMSTTVDGVPSLRKPLRKVDRSVRRALVLAMYGGYAVAAILWHISRTHHSTTLAVASFTVLAAALAAALTAFYRTGYWTWGLAFDSCLDERQKAVRNVLYGYCYAIVFFVFLLAIMYGEIATDAHWWLPNRRSDLEWMFWGVWALGLTLPNALLAWVDRPLPDDE